MADGNVIIIIIIIIIIINGNPEAG